jgi:hypothetical protein
MSLSQISNKIRNMSLSQRINKIKDMSLSQISNRIRNMRLGQRIHDKVQALIKLVIYRFGKEWLTLKSLINFQTL